MTAEVARVGTDFMKYEFLVETYDTERIKVVSVWSEFRDDDLPVRPRAGDSRGRSGRSSSRNSLQTLTTLMRSVSYVVTRHSYFIKFVPTRRTSAVILSPDSLLRIIVPI